jgi:hypothetical protein
MEDGTETTTVEQDSLDEPGGAWIEDARIVAFADQLSQMVALAADTNAKVTQTQETVANLAEVLKQFSEVNPQELMGMLGQMMGK